MQDPESAARASLRRSLLFYLAFLMLDLLAVYYIAASDPGGAGYVTLTIVAIVGVLLAMQVWMHVRDLGSPMAETDGTVHRKWTRADLIIVWNSYYINVERRVFRLRLPHFRNIFIQLVEPHAPVVEVIPPHGRVVGEAYFRQPQLDCVRGILRRLAGRVLAERRVHVIISRKLHRAE